MFIEGINEQGSEWLSSVPVLLGFSLVYWIRYLDLSQCLSVYICPSEALGYMISVLISCGCHSEGT